MKNPAFTPETSDLDVLKRQLGDWSAAMERHLLNGNAEKGGDAWDKRDRLAARIEELAARAGAAVNEIGRNGSVHEQDIQVGHLAEGEIVIPKSAQTPEVMTIISRELGPRLGEFTVGSRMEKRNPTSGLPAFADQSQVAGGPRSPGFFAMFNDIGKAIVDGVEGVGDIPEQALDKFQNRSTGYEHLSDQQVRELYRKSVKERLKRGPLLPGATGRTNPVGAGLTALEVGFRSGQELDFHNLTREIKKRGLSLPQ